MSRASSARCWAAAGAALMLTVGTTGLAPPAAGGPVATAAPIRASITAPGTPTAAQSARTRAAALAAAVTRLQRAVATTEQVMADLVEESDGIGMRLLLAREQLEAMRAAAAAERRGAADRARQLYQRGPGFGVLGDLLLGVPPQEALDRAQVAAALGATDVAARRTAAAAAGEAKAVAATMAALADRQVTLAAAASRRAAALRAELGRVAVASGAADEAVRRLAATERRDAVRRIAAAGAVRRIAAATERRDAERLAAARRAGEAASRLVLAASRRAAGTAVIGLPAGQVPSAYRAAITRAAGRCPALTPALLAGQLAVESGWNPAAVSTAGAEGLAQFLPATWSQYGVDADGDGRPDPFSPADAIATAASYDCALAGLVVGLAGDPTDLLLAAYNAGPAAVRAAGGVPPDAADYVRVVRERAAGFAGAF